MQIYVYYFFGPILENPVFIEASDLDFMTWVSHDKMRDMSSQINSDADWNAVTSSFIIIFIVSSMYTNAMKKTEID